MASEDTENYSASKADKASPWPLFIALGLAIGEVGVVLALYPLAVGGLILFVGSIAGIVTEAGYTDKPWRLLGLLGGILVVLGGILVVTQAGASVSAVVSAVGSNDTIVLRGFSIAGAGLAALLGSLLGNGLADLDESPTL